MVLAGRGFGKTRTGAEWVKEQVLGKTPLAPGSCSRIALLAETAADGRDVMVKGESGILAVHHRDFRPRYVQSSRSLQWPNGAIATLYNGTEPDQLRGPQHDGAWCFIAGTKVSTPLGLCSIETLAAGDMVLTRKGARRVKATRSRISDVGQVTFSNGAEIFGTADHPVYVNRGWTRMDRLNTGDVGCAIAVSNGAGTDGTGTALAGVPTTSELTRASGRRKRDGCTARSGSPLMANLLMGSKSTITTGTRLTTIFQTCAAFGKALIRRFTGERRLSRKSSGLKSRLVPFLAMIAGRPSSGSAPVLPSVSSAWAEGLKISGKRLVSALSAGQSSDLAMATYAVSVASTWRPKGRQSVYCLTVEGEPEFFANGILVHNCDELAKYRYAQEAWDQLQFGLRLGDSPRQVVTTTPRAIDIIKNIIADSKTVTTYGSTYDNAANLADTFIHQITARFEGTRLGEQELYAQILDDIQGALWTRPNIDANRYGHNGGPPLKRIVLAIDPPTTSGENADECGIVVCGEEAEKVNGRAHYQVLEDASVQGFTPKQWAGHALKIARYWKVDCIVAETNQGGEMIHTILDQCGSKFRYKGIHAKDGKVLRAEPVSALYEQNRVHHVGNPSSPMRSALSSLRTEPNRGTRKSLEDQMCGFTLDFDQKSMGYSPDRVDALVHCLTELHGGFTAPPPAASILLN